MMIEIRSEDGRECFGHMDLPSLYGLKTLTLFTETRELEIQISDAGDAVEVQGQGALKLFRAADGEHWHCLGSTSYERLFRRHEFSPTEIYRRRFKSSEWRSEENAPQGAN